MKSYRAYIVRKDGKEISTRINVKSDFDWYELFQITHPDNAVEMTEAVGNAMKITDRLKEKEQESKYLKDEVVRLEEEQDRLMLEISSLGNRVNELSQNFEYYSTLSQSLDRKLDSLKKLFDSATFIDRLGGLYRKGRELL